MPVLQGLFPEEFFQHHLLLLEAIHILNSDSISAEQLEHRSVVLPYYCFLFATLYGYNNMGINVHGLLHLVDVVKDLGPLWVTSCFSWFSCNNLKLSAELCLNLLGKS